MAISSPSRNGGFRARSRNTPRSRDRSSLRDTVSFVIVSSESQVSAARRTFLLGSIDSCTQSTPARVRIVNLAE
jgi:hypothetical protein